MRVVPAVDPLEDRRVLIDRVRAGQIHREAAAAVGCSTKSLQRLLARTGGIKPRDSLRSEMRLSLAEREEISRGLLAGETIRAIGRCVKRSASTISREVTAGGGRLRSRAWQAERRALHQARRPKVEKLLTVRRLRHEVERRLLQRWSPQQISERLRVDFPDDARMRVSHEAIYRSLFVRGRGALRRELSARLRSGRAQRRSRGRTADNGAGELKDMVLLSERPAAVEDRAVPGHWEGDLIVGRKSKSAIATLVERKTRFVMLCALRKGRLAEQVKDVLAQRIKQLPALLKGSLTWDRGKEMGAHLDFTVETGVQVYFCDPRSPWQRGTNENSDGRLRQYFPKGTDLSIYTQRQLDRVDAELNGRPRQTLQWRTPSESLAALLR